MNLVELTRYTNDEESAEGYLREQGILKTYEECPYCGSKRINRVRRFKYKCYPGAGMAVAGMLMDQQSQEIQIQVLLL